MLKASLSVFVPVHNGQAQIASLLSNLLEILPDLTAQFELTVIDDGSTDATPEIVHEMALLYPQMHLVVHPARWGIGAAIRSGLSHSSGDLALIRNEQASPGPNFLAGLWQAIEGHDVAIARPAMEASLGRIPQLPHEGAAELGPGTFAWCLARRRLLEAWRREAVDDKWLEYLLHHGRRIAELQIRPQSGPRPARPLRQPTRRPNYVARLRAFALGE